jgi:hypothetical protein
MPSSERIETTGWSGEGEFTQVLVNWLERVPDVVFVRVMDAPASRSEADYNFISNEVFVAFATEAVREPIRRFGFLPGSRQSERKRLTLAGLESALAASPDVGAPDYSDEGMLQYLRTERIVPPYQTKGYKLVELVRVYEIPSPTR